jgi:hypothetical protein
VPPERAWLPEMAFISEVLPTPLVPITQVTSPRSARIETPFRIWLPP